MRTPYTCAVCGYSWLSSKVVKRCSNPSCRSMKWNNTVPLAAKETPVEPVKPPVAQEMPRHDLVRKALDPTYVAERRQTIEQLKASIAAIPPNKSVLPTYEQPEPSEFTVIYE